MDNETFMRLLELVQQAGEGGYALAIVYLFKGYFIATLWAVVLVIITRLIVKATSGVGLESKIVDEAFRVTGVNDTRPFYASKRIDVLNRMKAIEQPKL